MRITITLSQSEYEALDFYRKIEFPEVKKISRMLKIIGLEKILNKEADRK